MALIAAAIPLAASCARVMPPPGGPRDEAPPAVLSITPASMSTIAPSDEPVVIEFDERISEQGVEDAVYVTPVTGSEDVSQGRRDIEVRLAGGWQPGLVYRVVVRPTIEDMFDNRLAQPIEVAFSTGASFSDAALAGVAYERVSATPSAGIRVEAHPVGGGAYYLAFTDTSGVFRMPLLPPGTYLLRGYADQNRDRRRDEFEPADSLTVEVGTMDTVLRPLALMRPDSSAANVTRVQHVDSVTLRVQFDDYMDVDQALAAAAVVRSLPDSAVVPVVGVFYPHVLTAERARQDSIARDSARAAAPDSVAPEAPADTVVTPAPSRTGQPRDTVAAADTIPPDSLTLRVREAGLFPDRDGPLPTRELMIVVERPLAYATEYVVDVTGIVNLAGIAGGGGTGTVRTPAAPPPPAETDAETDADEAADDTAEAPADEEAGGADAATPTEPAAP